MMQRQAMGRVYGAIAWAIQLQLVVGAARPSTAAAMEWEGEIRGATLGGFDSNAVRGYGGDAPDGFGSLQLSLAGAGRGGRLSLGGGYELGGRKFALFPSEDTLVQAATADLSYRAARPLIAGLTFDGKDRRGALRSYTNLSARAFVSFVPDEALEVRAAIGGRWFRFYPSALYDFGALEGLVTARLRIDRRHHLTAFGELGSRDFSGAPAIAPPGGTPAGTRRDGVLSVGLGYSYRGPWQASVSWSFLDEGSNSYGFRLSRHRLDATFGVRLPWTLLLLGQGNVQLTSFPDGLYLAPDQQLREDDENHNGLSLKLLRPLTPHWDLELKAALYLNRLPDNGLTYLRQVTTVGLRFRL